MQIKEAQRLAWANKVAKGFNTSDVPLEFMLLHGEIAESFQAWRRAQPDLGEELADVALYLFALPGFLFGCSSKAYEVAAVHH
ncbi:MAG: hypothetical protein JO272_00430 [Pseudonocardiales bacterium]|nr:hypothetical protein [Pseudonocardiales bacterium]